MRNWWQQLKARLSGYEVKQITEDPEWKGQILFQEDIFTSLTVANHDIMVAEDKIHFGWKKDIPDCTAYLYHNQ